MFKAPVTGNSGLTRGAAAYGLVVMTLLNFVNYIDRYVLPAVAPRIKEALSLTDTELGFLGSAFLFSYFLVSPLFGWLGDRLSRTRLMALGVGIWSLATAGGGLAGNFLQMAFARGAVGVGEASYAAISPALISDYYPPERRGRVFAVFYLAIPVGSAVGYLLGGALESHFGWRTAFFVVGLPGLLLALLTMTAPDPPRGINDAPSASVEEPGGYFHTLALLGRNRDYVLAVLGYAAYTFAVGGMSFWVPIYLNRERAMALEQANYVVGAITVVAGIGGTFLGGYLSDVLAPRIRQAHLYVSGVSMVLAIPFAWVAFSAADRTVAMAALLGAEFMVFLSTGPINVVLVSVVPVAIRATAMAVSIFFIHLFGDAAAPIVIGAVSDRVGLSRAVLIMPVIVAVSAGIWLFAASRPAPSRG
jgi:MFS transporter, Spinster family, sphingosine-1-phosphate transporter